MISMDWWGRFSVFFIRAVDEEFAEDEGGDQVMRLQLGLFKILK